MPEPGVVEMGLTLNTLFGSDLPTGLRWIIAFATVLVLVAIFAYVLRRISGGRVRGAQGGSGRQRQPRLGVVDTHVLDRERQLVLIRRDNVEHLVMIGGKSDVVIEANIVRGAAARAPLQPVLDPASERLPPFEGQLPLDLEERRPAAAQSAPVEAVVEPPRPPSRPAPAAPMPVPSAPEPSAVTPAAMPAAAAVAAAAIAAPRFARDHAAAPSVSQGELDDMARQLEEALRRPYSAVTPSASAPPSFESVPPQPVEPEQFREADPEPEPVVLPPLKPPPGAEPKPPVDDDDVSGVLPPISAPPARQEETAPLAEATPLAAPTPPAPPPAGAGSRPIPTPADVEAELELALGLKPVPRPLTAPAAVPAPVEPTPPAEERPAPELADDGLFETGETVETRGPVPDAHKSDDASRERGDERPAEPEARKPDPQAEPTATDPFSLDAIEAEFARLLGRSPDKKS